MANISQIKLPNNTVYDIKDNSGTKSGHIHDSTSIVPIQSKTFTGVIGTANNWTDATFFFGSVKPTTWGDLWKIKFNIQIYVPGNTSYMQESEVMMSGSQGSLRIYSSMNTVVNHLTYYGVLYRLKSAGFTNGYGHSIGCRFYSSNYPTDSNYKRTIIVDILETENCTFEFYDSCLKYTEIPGTGSTNYDTYSEINWCSNGLQETGDSDTIDDRQTYFSAKTGSKGVWATSLFMEDGNGTYQNICTASDGTVTSNNRTTGTTKIVNTNGFRIGGPIFYSSTTYAANSSISGWGVVYDHVSAFDSRYSLNTTLTAGLLTAYTPIYLVGTINNGLFYLDTTWWTQTPTTTGKIYVLIGGVYDSTTSNCRISLHQHNPWYYYDGTRLQPYTSSVAWSGISSKPTTISGYGITDAYTKTEVDNKVSAVLRYKGVKAAISNLPTSGNVTGDVWHVTATSGEYAWDGTEWQELGTAISIPANTGSSTTGISIANHSTTSIYPVSSSTTSVYGVSTSTTTASKVTLGTAKSIPNVTGATDVTVPTAASSATTVPIKNTSATTVPTAASSATACDDITSWSAGSGSASLTFAMDTTDTKKLKITFSHTHTAPALEYTARSITGVSGSTSIYGVQSSTTSVTGVSGSTTASKVTLGTAISVPNVTAATDVTVPIKNADATVVPIKSGAVTVVTSATHSVTDNGHTHTI